MNNLNCRLCGNAGSTAMIGSEIDDRIEVGHLVCDNLNCANGGSWEPNPPERSKMTQREFLDKVTALITEYETQHEDDTESVIGCILTLEDCQTIFEWNGHEMERIPDMYVRKVSKTEGEINDRKDNPQVVTNRMAEFQAMIDAQIRVTEAMANLKPHVGLMESTVLTWEEQFEIGGPFTFNEKDGE